VPGCGHRAVGSLGRQPGLELAGQRVTGPAGLEDLLVVAAGPGQLGPVGGRPQPQGVQRSGVAGVGAGDPQSLGHGGVGVGEAALQDGQLRRGHEQRRGEPGLGDGLGVGIAGHRQVLGGRRGPTTGQVELAAGGVDVDPGGGELGGHPVGRAAQQHLGVVPATEPEHRPGGRGGQERAVPAPQPLAGRQLGALQGEPGRRLQPPERLQQARPGGEGARHLVDRADRLDDPAGLGELPDTRLEVAEERQVHPQGPAGVPLLDQGADLAGDGDRLLAQLPRLAEAGLGDQRLAEGGQDLGPLGQRRAGRHQAHGRLVRGERALAAGRPQVAAEPHVQQPGPHRVGGHVHAGQRRPGQGDGPVRVTGQVRRVGRVLQHRGPVQAEPLVGVGHLVPQLEGQLEVPLGVGEPVGRLRLQSRLHGGG
jgi:hypothetical protein